MEILPKSLINSLKTKIKYNNYSNKRDTKEENNIFICISNNYNYGNNIKKINNNNYINNMDSMNKVTKNSSRVTFNTFQNNKNKEDSSNYKKNNNIDNLSIDSNHNRNNKELLIHNNNNFNFNSDNLSSTSADSFEIKRTYKNINQITEGNYIKDITFQESVIKYIKNYNDYKYNNIKNEKNNIKKEKSNNYRLETIENKNLNKNKKNNFVKKYIRSVKTSISNMNLKKLKNPMNTINLSIINDISLSSQKLRSNSTNKGFKELSLNSNTDNYNNTNQNTTDNIAKKYNFKDEFQRIDLLNEKKNTKPKSINK